MVTRAPRGDKGKTAATKTDALRIKVRGRDNAPLSIPEWRDALFEAARQIAQYEPDYRIKSADIYLRMVDENGTEVRINAKNEITIYPYKAAADEHGV
jgi:hypothetical protein